MFIVTYAGKFYGPFKTADDAAAFAVKFAITAPWQIVALRPPEDGL